MSHICPVNGTSATRSLNSKAAVRKSEIRKAHITPRSSVNGIQTRSSIKKPVKAVMNTDSVDVCAKSSPRTDDIKPSATTFIETHNEAGNALLTTFTKKLPFNGSLFVSKASRKEGMPIVAMLIKENWIGWKG